jgi:hypothetical protein
MEEQERLFRKNKKFVVCYEKWDYDKFIEIKNLFNLPKEIKTTLDKINNNIKEGEYIRVHYSVKGGIKDGRLYGEIAIPKLKKNQEEEQEWIRGGTSLQGLPKWIRKMICHQYYYDFDMCNCAPVILSQLLNEYKLCPNELIDYIKRRDYLLEKYSNRLNVSTDEIKAEFLKTIHMGNSIYSNDIPEIPKLKYSLLRSLQKLSTLNDDFKFIYKDSCIKNKENPMGRFCSVIWNRKESLILMAIRKYFIEICGYDSFLMVLCFDGIMIEKQDSIILPILEDLELYIKNETGYIINIKEKSLEPTQEDLVLFNSYK